MADGFEELVRVVQRLRGERGCPWDKAQTAQTLKPYLLEETYEVLEALDRNEPEGLKEELGDLLFQVLFHCQIASEDGRFSIQEVVALLIDKMVRRHPHVFGSSHAASAEAALEQWEHIKASESRNADRQSVLDGVPQALPALMRALQLQGRAARVGFDWPTEDPVWEKVNEELEELKAARREGSESQTTDELGDLLFAVVNLARHLRVDPESALRATNARFTERFSYIERRVREAGRTVKESTLGELELLWQEGKKRERS